MSNILDQRIKITLKLRVHFVMNEDNYEYMIMCQSGIDFYRTGIW